MRLQSLAATAVALLLASGCGPQRQTGIKRGPVDETPTVDAGTPLLTPLGPDAIIAASRLPAPLPAALAIDPFGVEIHRLKNGMTLYISTDRTKPEISAWTAIRAGSRNDPANSTGLAHYLEHMLFKGSSKLATIDFEKEKVHLDETARLYDELAAAKTEDERKKILAAIDAETQKAAAYAVPNEFDQLYAKLGLSGVNAATSDDFTRYVATIPSNRFAAWAKVEGDRFADPQYRLFYPELEAVYEEKNRSLDTPSDRVFEKMFALLFPKHPYGTQPTIGLSEHLKTPAYADMAAFYRRWYVPNNMAIILAGDIDAQTALPILEREFARLEPKALSYGPEARPPGDLSLVTGRQEAEIVAPGQNAVYLAWRAPVPTSPQAEVFEVLDLLMDNSTTGLLNTELVLSQLLPRAGSFVSSNKEAAVYVVYGTARQGQSHGEVEALLLATLEKLKAGDFTQDDIDAAIVNLEIAEKQKLQSNGSRVRVMFSSFVNGQPWPAAVGKLSRLRAVKREHVIKLANSLGDDLVVVKRVSGKFSPPKVDKPKITAVPIDTKKASPYAGEIERMPATALEPKFLEKGRDYQEHKLPAGPLVTAHNNVNDLFRVTYRWELGFRTDKRLCLALDALENSGSTTLAPIALRKELYAIGTEISLSCWMNSVTISVSGIDRNLEKSVELLRQWLSSADIKSETVAKLVANRISERKDLIAEPRFLSGALQSYANEGKRSPYLNQPSNKDLERLAAKKTSGSDLAKSVASLLGRKHKTGYMGPRKVASGAELEKAIGLGSKHRAVRARPPVRYRSASRPVIYFVDKTAAQAQVRVLWPKRPLPNKQLAVAALFSEYVGGGLGALILQEIREARGLAYSAGGRYNGGSRPRDASSLSANLGTQADKTPEAFGALLELLRSGVVPVDETRFAVAKSSMVESYRSTRPDPRTAISWVWYWQNLGFNSDPRASEYAAMTAMKPAEFAAFAKGLAKGGYIVAITGDKSRIDMKALAKFGKIIPVKPEALVAW